MARKKKNTKKTPHQRMAAQRGAHAAGEQPKVVHLLTYEVTNEPMPDPLYPRLPEDLIERLHDLVTTQSKAAIPELIEQIERNPGVPMLYNFLAVAYGQSGDIARYEQVVQENFQRFPEYLFARLNYAELLLSKHDYDRVGELLNHTFDIGIFYPERKLFHITEFVSFANVAGLYHIGVGNLDATEKSLEALKQVAPHSPVTKRFEGDLMRAQINRRLSFLRRDMLAPSTKS